MVKHSIKIENDLMDSVIKFLYKRKRIDDKETIFISIGLDEYDPTNHTLSRVKLPIPRDIVDWSFKNYDDCKISFTSDNSDGELIFEIMQSDSQTNRVNIQDIEVTTKKIYCIDGGTYQFKKKKIK